MHGVNDAWRFFLICKNYAQDLSYREVPWPASDNEMIIVLTGDRWRIPRAVELLRRRESPKLLVSGAGEGISKKELVNQQGNAAKHIHETWERILVESRSKTTIENAKESGKVLKARGAKHAILVTSDYHMPRSLLVFKQLYPDVQYWPYPVGSDVSVLHPRRDFDWDANLKFVFEFWKYFVFRHFFTHFV